jgi:hypothetical protein
MSTNRVNNYKASWVSASEIDLATTTIGYNLRKQIATQYCPKEMYGLGHPKHGTGIGAEWAHRGEQFKRQSNIDNDGVSDTVGFIALDKNGNVTTPFELNGEVMRPDKNGVVRITDKTKVDQAKYLKKYHNDRIDSLMAYALVSDDLSSYIFGVPLDDWQTQATHNGCPEGCYMSDKMKELDCRVDTIESMPPSIAQTQAISKLRKMVGWYQKNVNLQGLTNNEDFKSNIKDGHNNISGIKPAGLFKEQAAQFKEKALAHVEAKEEQAAEQTQEEK